MIRAVAFVVLTLLLSSWGYTQSLRLPGWFLSKDAPPAASGPVPTTANPLNNIDTVVVNSSKVVVNPNTTAGPNPQTKGSHHARSSHHVSKRVVRHRRPARHSVHRPRHRCHVQQFLFWKLCR